MAKTAYRKPKKKVHVFDIVNYIVFILIGGFDTTHCKMQEYAKEAEDPKVKQFFEKGARSAMENKQQLMKFLQ